MPGGRPSRGGSGAGVVVSVRLSLAEVRVLDGLRAGVRGGASRGGVLRMLVQAEALRQGLTSGGAGEVTTPPGDPRV